MQEMQEQSASCKEEKMKYETLLTLFFFIFLIGFLYLKRKKLRIQKILYPVLYMFLYRTKLGLKEMDGLAKRYPRILGTLATSGIFMGFIGMCFIAYSLIDNFIKTFFVASTVPGVALVLPFDVKGAIHVPIMYWILCIFIIAIVHEFSHGVVAKLHKIPVKSSGFAFLCILIPIIPAAFVEPDDKKLAKKTLKEQLSVFAAGPFSNIILAFICLGLLFYALTPAAGSVIESNGVTITAITDGQPAAMAGMNIDETIISIQGTDINDISSFIDSLDDVKPGETISIKTENKKDKKYKETVYYPKLSTHPDNTSRSYLGVNVIQSTGIKPSVSDKVGNILPKGLLWIVGLFYWLFLLNLGIGLFNLAPLGPLDGGRMMKVIFEKYFSQKIAKAAFKYVSLTFLALILIPLLYNFIR